MNLEDEDKEVLRRILGLLEFQIFPQIKEKLQKILNSKIKRQVYDAVDGSVSLRNLENKFDPTRNTINSWLKDWHSKSIVSKKGRGTHAKYEKKWSLAEVGLSYDPKKDR